MRVLKNIFFEANPNEPLNYDLIDFQPETIISRSLRLISKYLT